METLSLICVGKLKESFFRAAAMEYQKRLSAYCKLEIIELAETALGDRAGEAEIQVALELEARAIKGRLPKSAFVCALCVEGEALDSVQLSKRLEGLSTNGVSRLVFIIGGSHGLGESVKKAADLRLSMSKLTFPHHLARILLLEQLYRAYKIRGGGAYHK